MEPDQQSPPGPTQQQAVETPMQQSPPVEEQKVEYTAPDKPPEGSPPPVKKGKLGLKRIHYLIIGLLFILLITGAVASAFLGDNTTKDDTADKTSKSAGSMQVDCGLSGQSPPGDFSAGEDSYGTQGGEDTGSKIIARLLNKDPVVVEVMDYEPWDNYHSGFYTFNRETVSESSRSDFEKLDFGSIFEAQKYSYYVSGIELGIANDLYKIKELGQNLDYFNEDVSEFPLMNRSGMLIRYKKEGDTNQLVIFNDGSVYFNDSATGTTISEIKLEKNKIEEFLKVFAEVDYDTLENTYSHSTPAITLVCNRFQNVAIKGNEEKLQPIISTFEEYTNSLESGTETLISYRHSEEIVIEDWPFTDAPLSQFDALRKEAYDYATSNNSTDVSNPIYTPLTQELIDKIETNPEGWARIVGPEHFFRDNGRIYDLTFGQKECYGRITCVDNTLYLLKAEEIIEPTDSLKDLNLWPDKIGVDLSDSNRKKISEETYESNKEFFNLLNEQYTKSNFIDDQNHYYGVRVNRQQDSSTDQQDDIKFLLKVRKQIPFVESKPEHPLSIYMKSLRDDLTYADMERYYPELTEKLLASEARFMFKENGKYYAIYSNEYDDRSDNVTVFLVAKSTNGSTGYTIWNHESIKLSEIPESGVEIGIDTVGDNNMSLESRNDRYYIEGDYAYHLELSYELE